MPWTSDLRSQETLPAIVNRMSEAEPHKQFLRTVDGASATWEQLQEAMILWAARFLALDVKVGDVVATILDAGVESLVVWLGLSSVGAIDAATNPEFRGRMLAYAINNCQPELLVVAAQYLPFVEAVAAELTTVKRVLVLDTGGSTRSLERSCQRHGGSARFRCQRCAKTDESARAARDCLYHLHIRYDGPLQGGQIAMGAVALDQPGNVPLRGSRCFRHLLLHDVPCSLWIEIDPYHAAMVGARVVMRPRFALTRFWQDVAEFEITTGMLVGSMADLLLRVPESPTGSTSTKNLFMAPSALAISNSARDSIPASAPSTTARRAVSRFVPGGTRRTSARWVACGKGIPVSKFAWWIGMTTRFQTAHLGNASCVPACRGL